MAKKNKTVLYISVIKKREYNLPLIIVEYIFIGCEIHSSEGNAGAEPVVIINHEKINNTDRIYFELNC